MLSRIRSFLFENTSTKQTIIKNTFWLILAEGMNKGSIFLITILIARILGPEQFGVMSFVTAFVGMFVILTDFGLTTLMVREVSKDQSRLPEYLVNFSLLKVALGILTFIIVLIVSQWIGKSDTYITLILVYCLYAIVNNIAEFLRAFFRPSEQMQHEAYLKIINGLLFMGIVGYALYAYGTLEAIMYGFLVSAGVGLVVSGGYILKTFPTRKIHFNTDVIIHGLKRGSFIGLGALFISLYMNSDQIIMGFYEQYEALGVYSLAYKFTIMLSAFSGIIFMTILPRTAVLSYTNNIVRNYKRGLGLIFRYNFLLILVLESILWLAYRLDLGSYEAVIPILQLLLIYNIVEPLGYWGYINLVSIGKEDKNLYIVMLVGVLNVIGNLILIPIYSYHGAIFTTIMSYFLYFILVNHYILGGKHSNTRETT